MQTWKKVKNGATNLSTLVESTYSMGSVMNEGDLDAGVMGQ
jgi:hypothetical protein